MKSSELIEILKIEIDRRGDNELELIFHIREDKNKVKKLKSSSNISVVTGWVNKQGSDKIINTITMIQGEVI